MSNKTYNSISIQFLVGEFLVISDDSDVIHFTFLNNTRRLPFEENEYYCDMSDYYEDRANNI